ncbi:MAG: DivIVA domain-containing protein [Longimicrobiales bacterium]|nr:DivIVA domain-containing protein [Longimicrobiales bacterium]
MIDLTPLDVRKKRGDFARGVRGYAAPEVDAFLELVAERMEELVKENLTLRERVDRFSEQVTALTGRERAVHEALVTAQELRDEIQAGAQKEAARVVKAAEARAREVLAEGERRASESAEALHELDRRRRRFLASFRHFLQRELDAVSVEEARGTPDQDAPVDMELGGGRPVGLDPQPADDVHRLAREAGDLFETGAAEGDGAERG